MERSGGIFKQLAVLGDPLRARILLLLERQELTVSELCAVVQAPQPSVSRHLKALANSGWVSSHAEGTHRRYSLSDDRLEPSNRALWAVVRRETLATSAAAQDERRLRNVLAARRSRSREFFTSAAGQWDATRDELFGPGFHLHALLGLLDETWIAGDLGCGTGQVAEALAPFVSRVIAVDESTAMLRAARRRLQGTANVDFRKGNLEALPVDDADLDVATLLLVLHHLADPTKALSEVRRALKPGGRLVIVDMLPHDRDDYRRSMGHVWLGFSEEQLGRHLEQAGFSSVVFRALPIHPKSKGPALFAARARKPEIATPAGALAPVRSKTTVSQG